MKDIPNYEGLYAATEEGQIWSYISNKFLTPQRKNDGYWRIALTKNGEKKYFLLHRLLALTFIPNPENKLTVDHIDRNKDNNNINNLRWATSSEQVLNENTEIIHSCEHLNKMTVLAKEKNLKPIEQRDMNNHDILIATYSSAEEAIISLFGEYNKNKKRQIQKCARNENKSAYGYWWKYI